MIGLSDKNAVNIIPLKRTYNIGGKNITFETGKLGLLANGSVTVSDDFGNVLFITAGIKEVGVNEKADFFPLVVDYQEKFYATGKIGGNRFMKREGRPSESSILTSRIIDRPIRPMFPKGFINDVQIIATALSATNESDLGFFGITGASLALMMTGAPFEGPVSGVRIIKNCEGKFIFDPAFEEEQTAKLNLLVAGTFDAITMVESAGKEVSKDEMMEGLKFAFDLVKELSKAQNDFITEYKKLFGISQIQEFYNLPDESLFDKVSEFLTLEKLESLYGLGKKDFQKELDKLDIETKEFLGLTEENAEELGIDINSIGELVYKRVKKVMRKNILEKEKRLDLRALDEVRPIKCETGLLPRVHGSALFQRGMTQALSITTLGGPEDIQIVDDMYEETTRRYIHHYNFPPFSVGEVRMLRGVGRREIGHGKLAEKALEAVLPSEIDFPYMMRVVSETMTCNGSSSMASICGSTLSLMQAGVPITAPVAGIAMGMIYDEETGNYKILSDIQAQEDFLGDMDFKVAMSPNGITAMQLDVKIKGLSMEVFENAFSQARISINYILEEMLKVQPKVAPNLSPYAPLIMNVFVPVDKIREVIGKGGENVQRIEKEYNVKISIAEDGNTTVTAKDQIGGNKAIDEIKSMVWEPEVGYKGIGKIAKIIDGTGAIVEFNGKSGMIHISKLAATRVINVTDIVKEGEQVEFEVIEVNKEKGRIGLKRKFDPIPPKVEIIPKVEEINL
ncbi:MAG: polyribonucleotide nucleotidyltransferase [Candidatus Gracilibacteria bacterium]|nr:polyribonucleotide nucleotidyltransferase [Candidatus Gracilibacteria bacterium]